MFIVKRGSEIHPQDSTINKDQYYVIEDGKSGYVEGPHTKEGAETRAKEMNDESKNDDSGSAPPAAASLAVDEAADDTKDLKKDGARTKMKEMEQKYMPTTPSTTPKPK